MTDYIVTSTSLPASYTINDGDTLDIQNGGTAYSPVINSGGISTVELGGKVSGAAVNQDGTQDVYGVSVGSQVNGGTEVVASGAQAVNAVVSNNGSESILSGGTASAAEINAMGTLYIADGATIDSGVSFGGASANLIIGSETPSIMNIPIVGFANSDTIELAGVPYDSSGSAALIPTTDYLQVIENGSTFDLLLQGINAGATFQLSQPSDDPNGSEITFAPPVVTVGGTASYAGGSLPVALDSGLTVSDGNSTTLDAASVTISSGFIAGDALGFQTVAGITGSYDPTFGSLSFTGTASLQAYEQELQSVTYGFTSDDPTGGGTDPSRTITWLVDDGTQINTGTSDVSVSYTPTPTPTPTLTAPVVTAGASVSYTGGGSPAALDSTLTIVDAESTSLVSASVSISNGFLNGDTLTFANEDGITGSYNAGSGVLTFFGTADVSTYQTELDSVTFRSTATDPTDGGANPSRAIAWLVNDGTLTGNAISSLAVSYSPTPTPTPTPAPVPDDFDGNGTSDILWQDNSGDIATWTVQNGVATSATGFGSLRGGWSAAGTGDFYGNGTSDILFTNTNGDVVQWEMQGGVAVAATTVGISSTGWSVIGTGDLHGSGTDDVVFRYTDGTIADWQVQNGVAVASTITGATTSDWVFAGVANLSGTAGTNDLLFINSNGAVADWDVVNGVAVAAHAVGQTSSYWSIVGTGDFTSNGQNDILFRGQGGEIAMWTVQNNVATGAALIGTTTSDWQIIGLGDYNGDGTSDILFRNSTSGDVAVWEMSNGHVSTVVNVGVTGGSWQASPGASGMTLPS